MANSTSYQNINPHDDFFKVAFSRQDVVEDYITHFLKKELVENIDTKTLEISTTSYVTQQLEEYFSDIVWECSYGTNKKTIKISFLFEHKSYIPKFPHLQLLRYLLEIWEDCEKNKKPLTPIIPVIVYHNPNEKRHWKYKPFNAYFKDIDAFLQPYIPNFDYQITDLTSFSQAQWQMLRAGLLVHSLRTLQFGTNQTYILQNLDLLLVDVKNIENNEHLETFLVAQLVYILKNNEFSPENTSKIIQSVKNTTYMSTYDYLMEKAELKGKLEGKLEGFSEKEKDFTTSLILSTDFSDSKIALLVGVTEEYVTKIRQHLA
jgi:predicted transposase/invertase (TIGR01784 family)